MFSIIGEIELTGQRFNVIIRGTTEIDGERRLQRIRTAWSRVGGPAFSTLAQAMIRELSNFNQTQLKNSTANIFFRTNVGRGNRFEFESAKLITSTESPTVFLVVIGVSSVAE